MGPSSLLSDTQVNVELRSWLQIGPYIVKAESALDRPGPSSSAASSGGGVPLSAAQARAKEDELARREAEKRRIGTRLQVARALSSLGQGAYERAAREFLAVEGDLGEWGRTVSPCFCPPPFFFSTPTLPRGLGPPCAPPLV